MMQLARREPNRGIVPHARPCLGPDEEAAALRVLRSGRLAPGAEAARLEGLLARLSETADAVALSSGTVALTLALRALGIGERDLVALPSFACAALLHAVRAAGAQPLICDIHPETLALDPASIERRAPRPPAAVVVVHPFGMPAPLEAYRARGLTVIEDCAQALGACDRRRPVGGRGDAAIFSFAPTKVVTCGGPGGALVSPRASVVSLARDLATHDERPTDRARANALMGDLSAAIAAVQLGRLGEFRDRRAAIARRYDNAFPGAGARPPQRPPDTEPLTFRYLLRLPDAGGLIAALGRRGITARRPVHQPLHRLVGSPDPFPGTDAAYRELVSLPMSPALTDEEIDKVIEEVGRCLP